jgi:hypothetical protein
MSEKKKNQRLKLVLLFFVNFDGKSEKLNKKSATGLSDDTSF